MSRGTLRIYLGAAPGVGKTYAMLDEARRRRDRGTDVVAAFVDTRGRPRTAAQLDGLEVVPARGGAPDVAAVIARHPQVTLVDDLATRNPAGAAHASRWEDADELLDAGIDVIATLDVHHLAGLADVVAAITGVAPVETIPDAVVRRADQVELVDMSPEALRSRMAHGNIYGPEAIDAALANWYREENLAALRQLALRWVSDHVEAGLQTHRERLGDGQPWETRERVVVAISGAPGGDRLVRRAARIAARARAELVGVHVRSDHPAAENGGELLNAHRRLLTELDGRYVEVVGADVPSALVEVANAENASQLVLGATRRSRWAELTRGSVINGVLRRTGPLDVHVVSEDSGGGDRTRTRATRRTSSLPRRRRIAGLALAAIGAPLLTLLLATQRDRLGVPAVLMLFVLLVVAAAAVGGSWAGLLAAIGGFLLVNWYFTPPLHTWEISGTENVIELVAFLVVAATVSWYVATVSRRSADAALARADAETLVQLAAGTVADDPATAVLGHLRTAFALDGAAILVHGPEGWRAEAESGPDAPATPEAATATLSLADEGVLAVSGADLAAHDRRLLGAFAAHLAAALRARRLRSEAAGALELAQANELRNALLAAVSHDLRSPLAAIKASVTSLLAGDVSWSTEQVREFCEAIDAETDRLNALVGNLLDMSRLRTGTVQVLARPVGVDEVVPAALRSLGNRVTTGSVTLDVPETLPRVQVDPVLLERVVANLVENAVRWSPPDQPVQVSAGAVAGRVDLHVSDRGPGIAAGDRDRVFEPFQRLGDRDHGTGVGLGLAVARGFVEAMHGELRVETTPGGGLTMVVSLPVAETASPTEVPA